MARDDWFGEFIRVTAPTYDLARGMDETFNGFFRRYDKRPGADLMGRRSKAPHLNPTKGYRGAHKHFRGGSR